MVEEGGDIFDRSRSKMLSLSGPKALLFLQLLIAIITRSAVHACVFSKGFLYVSLVTNWASPEEVCLPSPDVLNCWLNMVASCLGDENELPLKVKEDCFVLCLTFCSAINSFKGCPQLGGLCRIGVWRGGLCRIGV